MRLLVLNISKMTCVNVNMFSVDKTQKSFKDLTDNVIFGEHFLYYISGL